MASFCDLAAPLLGALLSALLVLHWGWRGFIGGFFVFWFFCYLRLELLYYFEPERDAGVLDAAFISILSPALSLAWCSVFLLGRLVYRRFHSPRTQNT